MGRLVDLTGRRFGRLLVIKRAAKPETFHGREAHWLCQCDCGNESVVSGMNLLKGNTQSCGCLQSEIASKILKSANVRNNLSKFISSDCFIGTRITTLTQGKRINNKSGYKGVSWSTKRNKWVAQIMLNGKRHFLGYYDDIMDAVKARKLAEEKLFQPIIEEYKSQQEKLQ